MAKATRQARRSTATPATMGSDPIVAKSDLVDDLVHDWGESDGRAFYELSDTHSEIIKKCLMHGRDTGGLDIPYSRIEGFSATSSHIFDTMKVSVGASNMRED